MYKWLVPVISTALLTLPAVVFSAEEKPADAKATAKPAAKADSASAVKAGVATKNKAGFEDLGLRSDGDKPKPDNPPKRAGMATTAGMAGKSEDGGDKPKPDNPPKRASMSAKTGLAGKSEDGGDKPKPDNPPKGMTAPGAAVAR